MTVCDWPIARELTQLADTPMVDSIGLGDANKLGHVSSSPMPVGANRDLLVLYSFLQTAAQLHFDIFSIVITPRSFQLDSLGVCVSAFKSSRTPRALITTGMCHDRRLNSSIGQYTRQCRCAQRTTCALRPVTLQSCYHILETNDLLALRSCPTLTQPPHRPPTSN